MIEINSCPFWDHDDISGCARRKYIEFRFPLVILLTTLIYTFHIVFRERKNHRSESALEHQCETPEPGEHGNESRKDTRFSILRLNPAAENCGISSIKNDKSSFDKFKVFLEGVLIVIQFTIHLYALLNIPVDHKEFSQQSLLVKNFLWFFLLVVVSLRLFTTSQSLRWVKACQCNLWAVSLLSYALVFALSVISLRSVLIGKIEEKILVKYTIIEFCINLVLFLLLFTSNIEGINYSFLVEGENKTLPPNPTVFSLLTFARIDLLIWKAYKHCLENADVWDLNINDKSVTILKNLEKCSTHKTLLSNIMFYFKITFLSQLLLAFVTSVLTLVPLLLLPRILSYVDDPTSQSWNLMSLYVVFMLISRIVATTCRGQGLFLGEKGTMQLRTILVSHIYSKTLRRTILRDSTTSEQENDSQPHVPESLEENNDYFGSEAKPNVETSRKDNSVNNLMSVDAFKVSEGMSTFYLACEAMFMITMALIILYSLLGWSAFAGIFALLTMIPLNFWCATFYGKYQTDQLVLTDKRTSGISEALNSMRVIKLLAWEKIFYQNIVGVRNGEIRLLKKKGTIFFLNHLIWFFGPTLISVVTFSVFIKFQKQKLSPSIAFTALSLFAILRTPMDQITSTISLLIQSSISVQRIQDYLNEPDTRKYEILTLNKTRIGFEEADMEWEATETSFKLKHISIEFKQNSLNAIVCPTGSGKSSLLLGLLGELNLRSGRIYVPSVDSRNDLEIGFDGMANSMAYCSQSPWLITGTIEDNIVFGEVVNQQKLDAVIRSCCLDRDFKTMTAGSKTDVGGGGLSLSGGQQQRIALARAVYSSSRYLLLDDCLSTVDPETALHIYEQCLCSSSILKGRTCIITSHNISLITKWAHWLVILDNGEVEAQGTPSDLIESNNFLTECMNNDIGDECNSQLKPEPPTKSNGTRSVDSKRTNLQDEEDVQEAARIENSVETKMEGSVKFSTYKWLANYFGGIWIVFFSHCPLPSFMGSHSLKDFGSGTGWKMGLLSLGLHGFIAFFKIHTLMSISCQFILSSDCFLHF